MSAVTTSQYIKNDSYINDQETKKFIKSCLFKTFKDTPQAEIQPKYDMYCNAILCSNSSEDQKKEDLNQLSSIFSKIMKIHSIELCIKPHDFDLIHHA